MVDEFMSRHFKHLKEGKKEYTEAEVRSIMAAMQHEIDTKDVEIAQGRAELSRLQAERGDGGEVKP